MENVRNRSKNGLIEKDDTKNIIKQQSNLLEFINFSQSKITIHLQKQNLLDQPIYLGFTVLYLSKKLWYETYRDKFQPIF